MSLPSQISLPSKQDYQEEDSLNSYDSDLRTSVEKMYEDIVESVNGNIRNHGEEDPFKWEPTLNGSTAGTFTYTSQYGWSLRQGIYVHLFFDITWSATTATGTIYLELPYRVVPSSGMPFVGSVQASNFSYLGNYLVINAIPNTYRGEIWNIAPAAASSNVPVAASGRLLGHVMYIGVEDE